MSKGPGIQQRRIMDALQDRPAFHLDELLLKGHTRAEQVALNRAAWQLSKAGKIKLQGYACGRAKLFVTRPGENIDRVKYIQQGYEWQNRPALPQPKIISVE